MATVLLPLAFSAGASLLSRLLFPQPGAKGPRLSDLTIPASSYGTPIPRGWGRFRVTGNLIWGLPLKEKKKKTGGKGGPSNTTYSYFGSFAVLLCHGSVSGIRKIWANGELVYNNDPAANAKTQSAAAKFANYFRIYLGTDTQEPDDLIQAKEGVDKTPAYRGFCYLVFENLPLEKFGNRLPSISVEVIHSSTPVLVSTIISDLCLSAGLTTNQFDATEVSDLYATGFVINSVDTARSHIEKLQATYLFDVVDFDGKINFVKQCQKTPGRISRDDLGSYEYGNDPPSIFKETRVPYKELPNEVRLKYLNLDKDYAEAEEYARRNSTDASNRNVESLETSQVMSAVESKTVAERILYVALARGINYELFLPVGYLAYDPGRFMICELREGAIASFLIVKKELGANYLLRLEAVSYDPSVYDVQVILPPPAYIPSSSIPNPGNTTLLILDIPLVKDSDVDNGLYVASGGGEDWTSGSLYASNNGGVSYDLVKFLATSSTFGTCNTTLATGTTTGTDTSNTLTVTLTSGELTSVTAADLSNGTNKALVGNEVIQFQTAALVGAKKYTLSKLLRGRRGTEWAVGGHVANERFVLLTGDYLERIQGQVSDLGQPRLFKALTDGQALDDVTAVTITPVGVDLKPYAPINVTATKDPPGNITITWTRRDRHAGDRTDYANFPLSEAFEKYEVDVMSGTTVVRTLTANTPSVVYSTSEQATDFGSTQSTITCQLYQLSGIVGRGYPAIATLNPGTVTPPPTITSLNPPKGAIGSTVIVMGNYFTGATAVTFNGTPATYSIDSDIQITAVVPAGATTGLVTVTTPTGVATF